MSSITWSPIMAFAMLALAFTIGDYVSSKTKGIIASILTVDILFLIFGGILHILPPDLVQINFMVQITGAIGLALVLTTSAPPSSSPTLCGSGAPFWSPWAPRRAASSPA